MTQLNESPIITVERRKAVTIIISAVILSLSLGVGLMKVGSGFASRSSDGITVTGSAKTSATADNAVWVLSVSLSSPTVATEMQLGEFFPTAPHAKSLFAHRMCS